MGIESQRKGANGERELVQLLTASGFPARWGGNKTFGKVPDVSGLRGVHIECKRVEHLNLDRAMMQAEADAKRFRDGSPAVFHRRDNERWLVTMFLSDWLKLYTRARSTGAGSNLAQSNQPGQSEHSSEHGSDGDQDAHARFLYINAGTINTIHQLDNTKGAESMPYWENEQPIAVDTGRNIIEYFKSGRTLSISKPYWTDKAGAEKRGKTVALDLSALSASPAALQLLHTVLSDLETAQ